MAITSFRGPYQFLSNFYPSKVLPPTLEHHYQAFKTDDPATIHRIMNTPTPVLAKRAGKGVIQNYFWWDENKYRIMRRLVTQKFSEFELGCALLDTGDEELVEGNTWHDNYWGRCFCEKCACEVGQNNLGEILMTVRKSLLMVKS